MKYDNFLRESDYFEARRNTPYWRKATDLRGKGKYECISCMKQSMPDFAAQKENARSKTGHFREKWLDA
ncbi:hypothetical protein [Aestuariivirga sp.]|uniref:hypothetical protein n=1 Tax=Aestuariivirga sp. TaxID=2650926 RepID=UPI0039E56A3F